MIVVYPMLVSRNISSYVLPGISKVLEKYKLTYDLDEIIRSMNKSAGLKIKRIGSKLKQEGDGKKSIKENIELLEQKPKGPVLGTVTTTSGGGTKPGEVGTVKVDMPSFNSLSLEPTWIKVDTYYGTRMLGIKVVPFPVSSDEKLIDLVTSDYNKDRIQSFINSLSRKVVRTMWAILRKLPFVSLSITGDPKKDIIFAESTHARNIYLVMNSMDIGHEFLEKTKKIKQLFKLGWRSFVVTDDVNKFAYFCMEDFNGMCSSVQFNFLYASISKEHGRVFDTLEDIRKSSSPFFRLTKRATKVMGEQYVSEKINKYLIG